MKKMRATKHFVLLSISLFLVLFCSVSTGENEFPKGTDFKQLRKLKTRALKRTSMCTMILIAEEKPFGCWTKVGDSARYGTIKRVLDINSLSNMKFDARGASEDDTDATEDDIFLIEAKNMKTIISMIEKKEIKVIPKGVLIEHPAAFANDFDDLIEKEVEASVEGFLKGDLAKRFRLGETPVAFLGVNATREAVWAAEENVKRLVNSGSSSSSSSVLDGIKDELIYAKFESSMEAAGRKSYEALEEANSISCLGKGTCLPIGGYSVATAFLDGWSRYLYNESAASIFVTTRLDKTSMFRDDARGANAVFSSLISFLVAAEVVNDLAVEGPNFEKPIVFAAFAGEDYDFVGSKRMLEEFPGGIDTVIEIGSVGFSSNKQKKINAKQNTLYVHEQYNQTDDSFEDSLKMQANANREKFGEEALIVQEVSRGVEVPESSSLNSFQNVNGSRVTVSDYSTFESDDPFDGTPFDSGMDKINVEKVAEVGRLIAGAAIRMSMKDKEQKALKSEVLEKLLDPSFILQTIASANELASCLVDPKIGLQNCYFARRYGLFSENDSNNNNDDEVNTDEDIDYVGSSYVGVVQYLPEDIQISEGKSPIQRFVYEHLSHVSNGTASTSYRLALPAQLKFDREKYQWQVRDGNGNGYEIWTESNWSNKLGVAIKSNKGWYVEPLATVVAVAVAVMFCIMGEKFLMRKLINSRA